MTIPVLVPGLLLVLSPALMAHTFALKDPAHALTAPTDALKAPDARAEAPEEITIILAQASISEGQAASMAKSKYGGKVLSVSKSGSGGRVVYRVKLLLDSGRVIIVTVDGQTGRVSG